MNRKARNRTRNISLELHMKSWFERPGPGRPVGGSLNDQSHNFISLSLEAQGFGGARVLKLNPCLFLLLKRQCTEARVTLAVAKEIPVTGRVTESRGQSPALPLTFSTKTATPGHAQAISRHRFHCIDLLSLDRGGGLYSPPSQPSRAAGPAY